MHTEIIYFFTIFGDIYRTTIFFTTNSCQSYIFAAGSALIMLS